MGSDGQSAAAGQTIPDQSGHFPTHQVVYVGKDSASNGAYNVFSVREDLKDTEKPYDLVKSKVQHVPESVLSEFLLPDGPADHLRDAPDRKIHVVVSTGSGTGLASKFYDFVLRPLLGHVGLSERQQSKTSPEDGGSPYTLLVTKDAQSIQRFARDLNISAKGSRLQHTVVLLSGDGGAIELLNGKAPGDHVDEDAAAAELLPLVAMLPLGTGNGLFHSVHKPLYAAKAGEGDGPSSLVLGLRTLLRGRPQPLPSFKVDFSAGSRTIVYKESSPSSAASDTDGGETVKEESDAVTQLYGAIVASYGFHSQLVWESDTPAYRRHGSERFKMVAAELLKENHAYRASVELITAEGPASMIGRERHAYILSTPLSDLEKTFTISPASRPLDGVLRLVHFGPVSPEKTMEIMMAAYNGGSHVGMQWKSDDGETQEQVGYEAVRQVRVTTREDDARWRKVCIDGTIVEIPRGGSMTVTMEDKPHLRLLVHPSIGK
ncbi:hypothetical protein KJ359_006043 [Pestalotiopsis sp. 9143b]|nr:hypothetical protein KJ359_006043 [Pestalotiopsis sp. 9143b]